MGVFVAGHSLQRHTFACAHHGRVGETRAVTSEYCRCWARAKHQNIVPLVATAYNSQHPGIATQGCGSRLKKCKEQDGPRYTLRVHELDPKVCAFTRHVFVVTGKLDVLKMLWACSQKITVNNGLRVGPSGRQGQANLEFYCIGQIVQQVHQTASRNILYHGLRAEEKTTRTLSFPYLSARSDED